MKSYVLTAWLALVPACALGQNSPDASQSQRPGDMPARRHVAEENPILWRTAQFDGLTIEMPAAPTRRRGSTTDMILDWGVRPNDPNFDNGKVISEAIARGDVRGAIFAPSGTIYHSTTIDLGSKTGLKIVGGGIAHQLNEAAFANDPPAAGRAATRFVYTGPADQPAFRYRGLGLALDGIVIQRGHLGDKRRHTGTGFLLERPPVGYPTGKMHWGQIAFANWEIAVDIQGANHCDNSAVDWCWFQNCKTGMHFDNEQAVNWDFQFLKASGAMERVFHYVRGAGLHIATFDFSNAALIFQLDKTSSNSCDVIIDRLKVDNNARGWRLLEMARPGPLYLRVNGLVGLRATPGENPIVLKTHTKPAKGTGWLPGPGYHDLKIDLYNGGSLNAFSGKSEGNSN